MQSLPLTVVSQSKTKLVLSWPAQTGAEGFEFIVDGTRSNSWNGNLTEATFSATAKSITVNVLGVTAQGVYPPVTPPPPPPPPPPSGVWAWDATKGVVASNSAAFVKQFAAQNTDPWFYADVAVVTAASTDPSYKVTPSSGGPSFTVRVPKTAAPGPSDDHHLCIIDPTAGLETDMFTAAVSSSGVPTCEGMAQFPIGAVNENNGQNAPGTYGWGATAALLPLNEGLIRPSDLVPGAPTHPLVFSCINATIGIPAVYPSIAGRTDLGGASAGSKSFGFGAWLALPSSLSKPSNLSVLAGYIWDCLTEYGMFLRDGDYEPYISIYGEYHPVADWAAVGVTMTNQENGVTSFTSISGIPWGGLVLLNPPS